MRADRSKRLTVLSEAEKLALYGLPDFDDFQRAEFFALTEAERALADRRKGLAERVWCLLQIGYFKAKRAFFRFSWQDVPPADIAFLIERYFPGTTLVPQPIRANEHYAQRDQIAGLFGYRLWAETDRAEVAGKAGGLPRDWGCGGGQGMTGRVFDRLGIKDGMGFAPGGDWGRWVEPKRRRDGDRPVR